MFVVHSTHAQSWPAINFRLKKGENRFPNREAIPAEVMPKLEYLSKPKKSRDGQRFPAVIRFYEASGAGAADDEIDVDITAEGLAPLSFKVLQALALKLRVDATGLTSKKQLAARILEEASGASAADEDEDESDEDDSDDDASA